MHWDLRKHHSRGMSSKLRLVGLAIGALSVVAAGIVLLATPARSAQARPSTPPVPAEPEAVAPGADKYVVIGWNDLGMHCMNESFANLAVLPPYNTLWAQVIRQGTLPEVITRSVKIDYSILDNTYSAGKTNFWQYAKPLFGVNLPPNVGLTGATLAGEMHTAPDHFTIEGVPLTPYRDSAPQPGPVNWYPYQLAHMVARDAATGQALAETTTVAPVSTEMHCDYCHSDGQREGIRTGNVETNILTLHDNEEGTNLMGQRPVLCAQCHGSNALSMPGNPELPNLSRAMHGRHQEVTRTSNDCYNCHPGQQTQCLRDVMYQRGLSCTDCHGSAADVANPARRPWIDLPRCATCHAAQYAENPGKRYRDSVGHGGLYCEACHGSPHAILPTNQANDNLQNVALQGHAGTLNDCTVCHGATTPAGLGPHGLLKTRLYLPLIVK
jgi:Cytochrome c554 and c-prime